MREPPKELIARFNEIKKLYDLNEAETVCMSQMAIALSQLGFSGQLTVKLLRALTAMWEIVLDEKKAQNT